MNPEAYWKDQFKRLDKAMPRYDASKVRDFNKVVKHYQAEGFPAKVAGTPAHCYNEYRAGNWTLDQAARECAKDMKRFQRKAGDDSLRKGLVRLAHAKPELRPVLLPLLKQSSINKQAGYSLVDKMNKAMVTFIKHFAKDLQQAGYDVTVKHLTVTVSLAPGEVVVFELDPHNLPTMIKFRGLGRRLRLRPGEIAAGYSDLSSKRALKVLKRALAGR